MKLLKLDFLGGKKTYITGILMILHGGSQIIMDLLSGQTISDINVTEFLGGFGLISLRKAM